MAVEQRTPDSPSASLRENQEFETDAPPGHCSTAALDRKGIPMATCPKCNASIQSAKYEGINLTQGLRASYAGVALVCPQCQVVLGVQFDPLALKNDLVQELFDALHRKGL